MSIGLGMSRPSRQGVRIGGSRATVREVCLLGIGRARNEPWTTGQKIVWLGRGYQVLGTSTKRAATPGRALDEHRPNTTSVLDYVHLSPCDED
jgi:hypothetical protein